MKKQLCLLGLLCLSIITRAQDEKGIKWTTGLSWEQVKQKAKAENKYIFLDCFATWCGPCKAMDESVYPDEEVGNFFNVKFISVKVQMDKTKKDDEFVKSWYDNAEAINKQYHVEGYPTFVFFTPNGALVSKEIGGLQKQQLIVIAKAAVEPGKIYNDPYAEYARLREDYQNGIKDYHKFPYMINMAFRAKDDDFGKQLLDEHTNFAMKLETKERYTKENIQLWSSFLLKSDGQRFKLFFKKDGVVDKVMNSKGYTAKVVDRTIWNEIVKPFLEEQAKGSDIPMSGMMLGGPGVSKLEQNTDEADWHKLNQVIRKKFSAKLARRNVVAAKIEWYLRHRNYNSYSKYYLKKIENYVPDLKVEYVNLNSFGWTIFLYVTDVNIINKAASLIKKVLGPNSKDATMIDTYANLLYKAGKRDEAIQWEEKAVVLEPANKGMVDALAKMKVNEPTYVSSGAKWE